MNSLEIFTAVDLEMNQPSRSIIQIGACVGNVRTGAIFDKISLMVNPLEQINPEITKLTKITQEDVDNGYTLEEAYQKLRTMHERYGAFVNCITWGGGDTQELLEQLKKNNELFSGWCFGRRWIDVKTLFVSWRIANGRPIQGGLGTSMTKIGLRFEGQKHNAMDDAVNTFRMYSKMLHLFKKDEVKE